MLTNPVPMPGQNPTNMRSALKVNHVQIAFVGFPHQNVYMKSSLPKGRCSCTTVNEPFVTALPGYLVYSTATNTL